MITEDQELRLFATKIKEIKGTYTGIELLRFQSILENRAEEKDLSYFDYREKIMASSEWGTLSTYKRYLIKALGLSNNIYHKSFHNLEQVDKIKLIEYTKALKTIEVIKN